MPQDDAGPGADEMRKEEVTDEVNGRSQVEKPSLSAYSSDEGSEGDTLKSDSGSEDEEEEGEDSDGEEEEGEELEAEEESEKDKSSEKQSDDLDSTEPSLRIVSGEAPGSGQSSSGSNSDEGSQDDSDSSYSSEPEPTFKYKRFDTSALGDGPFSSLAVSESSLALGTYDGDVCVTDLEGHLVSKKRLFTAAVTSLSRDGDYLASASMDGRVQISHEGSDEAPVEFDLKRPVNSVVLEDYYGKRTSQRVVTAGMAGTLCVHEKGWLGYREVVWGSGHGPIFDVSWNSPYLAYSDETGVRVLNTQSGEKLGLIKRENEELRPDLFRCSLVWKAEDTLIIGWGEYIKVVKLKQAGKTTTASVEAILELDAMIAGLGLYRGDFIVLCYLTDDDDDDDDGQERGRPRATRPEIRLVSEEGEELSSDAISVREFERLHSRDYRLVPGPGRDEFVVLSPRDIVLVEPRDDADHVRWLLDDERYEEALECIKVKHLEAVYNVEAVESDFLSYLMRSKAFDEAAQLAHRTVKTADEFERLLFAFAGENALALIIPFVPISNPQLSSLAYELVLAYLIEHDGPSLLQAVKTYPVSLYDARAVAVAIEAQLERRPEEKALRESLCVIYPSLGQAQLTIPHYLRLGKIELFDLILKERLFSAVRDRVKELVLFGRRFQEPSGKETNPALRLLIDHTDTIPINTVVEQLRDEKEDLYVYLDGLFRINSHLAFEHADLQIELYAEFEPARLLPFLKSNSFYSLEKALRVCTMHPELIDEEVYVLGRMGSLKKALDVLLERSTETKAIAFVKEQDDRELWNVLLTYAEERPLYMRALLLESVKDDSVLEPATMIRRIRKGFEIPALKELLITVLQDLQLQVSIVDGCARIVDDDVTLSALELRRKQTEGFLAHEDWRSSATGRRLFGDLSVLGSTPGLSDTSVALHFLCGHSYSLQEVLEDAYEIPLEKHETLQAKLLWLADLKRRHDIACAQCV